MGGGGTCGASPRYRVACGWIDGAETEPQKSGEARDGGTRVEEIGRGFCMGPCARMLGVWPVEKRYSGILKAGERIRSPSWVRSAENEWMTAVDRITGLGPTCSWRAASWRTRAALGPTSPPSANMLLRCPREHSAPVSSTATRAPVLPYLHPRELTCSLDLWLWWRREEYLPPTVLALGDYCTLPLSAGSRMQSL